MSTPLTPAQKKALAQLVVVRYCAKKAVQTKKLCQSNIARRTEIVDAAIRTGDLKAEAINKIDLAATRERLLEIDFQIIELGHAFRLAAAACEEVRVPRESWLRALSVNESEWHTPDMLKYGKTIGHVVSVLHLENSATKDDAIEHKPLDWCTTMAMFNATRTNPKLGEFMHDKCNEMFGGAFGEYQPPTMLEQLGVAHG
jgi:hypothetical protein